MVCFQWNISKAVSNPETLATIQKVKIYAIHGEIVFHVCQFYTFASYIQSETERLALGVFLMIKM